MTTRLPNTFEEYREYALNVRRRADKLQHSLHDQGWALAASVGIDRNLCCLHNASIDTEMRGWCKGNPHRLKVAKQAMHILDDWQVSRLADRLIKRAWNHYAKQNDCATY